MKQESIRYRWFTIVPLLSLAVATVVIWAIHLELNGIFSGLYTWRWIALGPLISLVPNIIMLAMLLRTKLRKGSIMWFTYFVFANVCWLLLVTICFLSDTPSQAQFWYNVSGLFWIPIPVVLYWFILCYVSDNEVPPSLGMTIGTLFCAFALVFVAGSSDLVNHRGVTAAEEFFWGYEAPAVGTQLIVVAPALILTICALVLLSKARKRTINETRRKQLGVFMFAFAQYMVFAIGLDAVLPNLFDKPPTPVMTWFYSTTLALIIGYGVLKYGIFRISPTSLSKNILQSLSEAVLGLDEKLRIEFANSGAETIFGYNQDWLKGEPVSKLFPGNTYKLLENRMQAKEIFFELEDTNILHKSGREVPVALSLGRVFDDRNQLAGYIMVAANITELKRKTIELADEKASVERKVVERTRELSEEHARLTASIDSLSLGFFMTGVDDSVFIINQSAKSMFNSLAESQSIDPPANWDLNEIVRVFEKGLDLSDPIHISRTRKQPMDIQEVQIADRFIHVFAAPVTVHDEVIGAVVLLEDITEERILNRSKDEFFSIASHELRTPLTRLQGNAELMRDVYAKEITSEQLRDVIQRIEGDSTHMMQMVNSFLEMTELEQGKTELHYENFDITAVARESMDYHVKHTARHDVQGEVQAEEPIHITADRAKTRQLFDRYLSNAFKFTETGMVTIAFEQDGKSLKVLIKDTGKGIKIENQSLLFRKFQQAGSSLLTRDGEGTGIGLYIIKLLAEKMGGQAGLETTEEDQGSVFYFTLPITGQASEEQ